MRDEAGYKIFRIIGCVHCPLTRPIKITLPVRVSPSQIGALVLRKGRLDVIVNLKSYKIEGTKITPSPLPKEKKTHWTPLEKDHPHSLTHTHTHTKDTFFGWNINFK